MLKVTLRKTIGRCALGAIVLAGIVALFAILAWDDGRTDVIRCNPPEPGYACAY